MDSATQKKILGYFIEEAKEHLETLEDGILDLSEVAADDERVNELFRAAHSIKGGSAMLGYAGIQKTAHRLEDAFKIFKSEKEDKGKVVPVDQTLETLFFETYDVLKHLIEELANPEGLPSDEANRIYQESEPRFVKLQKYLDSLVGGGTISEDKMEGLLASAPVIMSVEKKEPEVSLLEQAKVILRQMLDIFKQEATPENREQLGNLCDKLAKLETKQQSWQNLLKVAKRAIANPKYSYQLLAPVIIKELKQGISLIVIEKPEQIAPSNGLEKLATASLPQILITIDPESAAMTLKNTFNKSQLSQLVQLLG
jgi:chemotaxis protein histidine kinase CheA